MLGTPLPVCHLPMGESVLVFMRVLFFIRAAFSSSEACIFWRAYDVILEVFCGIAD
jgi:hypothetical protein